MWYQAAAIRDPRVCSTVTSEGSDGAAKQVFFCLPELSDALLLDILVSLSQSIASEPRRSRGCQTGADFVPEGGVEDVD